MCFVCWLWLVWVAVCDYCSSGLYWCGLVGRLPGSGDYQVSRSMELQRGGLKKKNYRYLLCVVLVLVMAEVAALVQAGKDLGFSGEELQGFVKQHQEDEREQRAVERDKMKQAEEFKALEMEKLRVHEGLEKETLRLEKKRDEDKMVIEKGK